MKKQIFKYMTMGFMLFVMNACCENENDLLAPKVYFESKEDRITIPNEGDALNVDLMARLSNMTDGEVNVSYSFAGEEAVKEYNSKNGTNYLLFNAANAALENAGSSIESKSIYAGKVQLTLSKLSQLEEGKSYILPVKVASGTTPVVPGSDIKYIILSKPIYITKVGTFSNSHMNVKFPSGTFFKSFTYEALIYSSSFYGSSHTIMGVEGVMILRVGDTGGGIAGNILQIAGRQHYEAPDPLLPKKWYHLALTYDQSTGKTVMYVNGSKWAESAWGIPGFDPNADVGFKIGKLLGFPWGERPFSGYMSEIRVWSVARSENQIKQNMLGVDPQSDGLELYYKLNGTDKTDNRLIYDSAKNIEAQTSGIVIKQLDAPITIN